ncbi:MAG TPA: hypothetical protein VEM96_10895 [Pyrinomonadaceae bacterium]|nr:hypothetical protein [Pyrinomonadaceae bacterium]
MRLRQIIMVFGRVTAFAICFCLLSGSLAIRAQQPKGGPPTADQIVEGVILIAGNGFGRQVLNQIRRNGIERGRSTRMMEDGRSEEARYELRFVRGDKSEKDKVRIDNKTAQSEYSMIYGAGRIFGIINGSPFTPRAEASANFIAQQTHSIDALLRYKENESKLSSAGKDKQQGIDVYVIDLIDTANRKTRYFISAKSFRVLWLEYEETPPGATTPIKYTKRFYDYRIAQSTQVPYRTVLMEDGKQILETRILTVTYGVKMEDSLFQNPEAASSAGNP